MKRLLEKIIEKMVESGPLNLLKQLSVIFFFITLSSFLIKLSLVVEKVGMASDAITIETVKTLQSLQVSLDQINITQQELLKITKSVENNLFLRVDSIERNLFHQTAYLLEQTNVLNSNINRLTEDVSIVLNESSKTVVTTNKTIEDLNKTVLLINQNFDCEVNSFCTPNLIQETLLSVRNVSQDANRTFLLLNESIPQYNSMALQITKNVEEITKNVARLTKPKWYDRVVSSVIAGAAITASVKK